MTKHKNERRQKSPIRNFTKYFHITNIIFFERNKAISYRLQMSTPNSIYVSKILKTR